jgi:chorismate mutase
MDIGDWRRKIDDLDRKLVTLINQRAECALAIGRLKRTSDMPVYEPDRERVIFENVARNNAGPLSDVHLRRIFERLVDVMRQIQGEEMTAAEAQPQTNGASELEPTD